MILSDRDLKDLIKSKQLKIEPFDNAINPTSIDLRLGSILVKYLDQIIKLDTIPESKEIDITNDGYVLQPGEFVLGMTVISSIFWPCLRSISWPQAYISACFTTNEQRCPCRI